MRELLPLLALLSIFNVRGQNVSGRAENVREFHNEAIILNATNWPVLIKIVPKKEAVALQGAQFMLQPGSRYVIANYTDPKGFVSPVDVMSVTGTVRNNRGKERSIGVLMMEKKQVDATHRTYFYHVMPSGGSVGFSF